MVASPSGARVTPSRATYLKITPTAEAAFKYFSFLLKEEALTAELQQIRHHLFWEEQGTMKSSVL